MSKAEERALECIPTHPNEGLEKQRKRFREFYVDGYEQAEKDLAFTHITPTDNEKQAAVHYMEDCEEVDDFVRRNIDEIVERYFVAGAKWKEKDLVLTWEDVKFITDELVFVGLQSNLIPKSEMLYKEVLRRFNEQRNKKLIK